MHFKPNYPIVLSTPMKILSGPDFDGEVTDVEMTVPVP